MASAFPKLPGFVPTQEIEVLYYNKIETKLQKGVCIKTTSQ